MQGVKAGRKIFRGENEGKANDTALLSESFNYNCSYSNRIVIKGKPVTEGKSTSLITRWTGHLQQPGASSAARAPTLHWLGNSKFQLQKHQRRPLALWKTKITWLWTTLEHQWNALCVLGVWKSRWLPPLFKAYHSKLICRNNLLKCSDERQGQKRNQ